jgi:ribosomal protein S4E
MQRQKLITLSSEGKDFQTTESNVFVVGEKKPAIEVKVQ